MRIPSDKIAAPCNNNVPEVLKHSLYIACCGHIEKENPDYGEKDIISSYLPVWQEFKQYDFDLDRFMNDAAYEQIEDEEMILEILMAECFPGSKRPVARFMIDWLNGHLDFFKMAPDVDSQWKQYSQLQILHCLYNCNSDYEIWDFIAEGVGDMTKLYYWYKGENQYSSITEFTGTPCYCEKDEEKAEQLLNFILKPSTNARLSVRKQAEMLKRTE